MRVRVLADGHDITRLPMYLRARNYGISYLPQEPSVFRKLTVEDNILAVLETQQLSWESRRTRTEKLIEQLNLGPCAQDAWICAERWRTPDGWRLRAAWRSSRHLFCWMSRSRGSIRLRCWICRRLSSDLKRSGIGVLITDHNVRETLSVTDRAYIINEGRIFRTGTPGELGRDPEVRRIYLGEKFSMD